VNSRSTREVTRSVNSRDRDSRATKFGKMVKIQKAVNQITTPMQPSQLTLDICDQRFLCRMAKKLGCQFCAKKSL